MSGTNAIETRGLGKQYGDVAALGGIDLTVAEGQVFGLLGPNGAGKTTAVKILTTLARADSGTASVLGFDVARQPDQVRAAIGYVAQELTSDRTLTGRENLELFTSLYHLPRGEARSRVDELIGLVGLGEAADRRVRTYSGGMRKKLDLACGLVHRPRLLFLDEPSLGLDVEIRRAVWDHILELKRTGTTVFLCTNYMDEADKLCDRVTIVDGGQVVATGTPAELRAGLGGDVVTIELHDPARLADAERVLQSLPAVKESWHEAERVHATVAANETALPALLEGLSKAGLQVRSVSYHRPGLEEVFLRHAGKRYQDAQGTSGPPKRRR